MHPAVAVTAEASTDLRERMRRYARELRSTGAIRTSAIEEAFAGVPRHVFLSSFRLRRRIHVLPPDGTPAEEVLDLVYANNSLPTRDGSDGEPTSSSSEPALMARMLELADLAPGARVLEIGAGTGYNAALIACVTGGPVTSIEVGPTTAAAAAAALRRAGFAETVRVIVGDGYAGASDGAPWDRIIVTCGIAGIPPRWLDVLAPDGLVVAPIAFAGYHPVMVVRRGRRGLGGRIGVWADFMQAVGPLRPRTLFGHNAGAAVGSSGLRLIPGAVASTTTEEYRDLTCYLGAHDARTTRANVNSDDFNPGDGMTALVEGDAAAWAQRPGRLAATEPSITADPLVERLRHLVERWIDEGRPAATEWSAAFEQPAGLEPGLLTPTRWGRTAGGLG